MRPDQDLVPEQTGEGEEDRRGGGVHVHICLLPLPLPFPHPTLPPSSIPMQGRRRGVSFNEHFIHTHTHDTQMMEGTGERSPDRGERASERG